MQSTTNESLHQKDKRYYLPTFKRFPLAFRRGRGARLWDVEGKEYIDALAGIAVNNLGHCHPRIVRAVQRQAETLIHISNFYVSEPQVRLSQKLVEASGLHSVFFSNSGAESVEGAFKIARKYARSHGRGGGIIAMEGSFHGRTLATIATGKETMQRGFGPMPGGFHKAPFNDLEPVREMISDDIAAIILEPIQGEGGINVAEAEYLQGLRALCDREDIVLIFDEIQCGIGRTGRLFAKDHYGVQPDIMTLAKGLGSGLAVGAILSNRKVSEAIDFGDHGTTFGGNPMACAAALATLEVMDEEDIPARAASMGQWLMEEVRGRRADFPGLTEVRGKGLMVGLEFAYPTKPLVGEMLERGVLANATAGNVIRLVPPLIISRDELQRVLAALAEAIDALQPHRAGKAAQS